MAPKLYMKYVSPPCRAVLTVAKALGIELEIEEVDKEFMSGPEILELNPQHTIPILIDDDFVLWDSHAINGYLVNKYGSDDSLYPIEPRKRALVDQRLHFECSVLYPRFSNAVLPILRGLTTDVTDDTIIKIEEACVFLNAFLENKVWLAGDEVTIADYSVLCTLTTLEMAVPIDEEKYPRLFNWLQSGKELSAFKEANQVALEKTREFIAESPPARGAYLVIKALGLDVEIKEVNVLTSDYITPELIKANPQHTIPTLVDGEFSIWDSHAISGYLVGQYGTTDELYPKDPKKRATVDQRLYFDTEWLFPKLFETMYPLLFQGKMTISNGLRSNVQRLYRILEEFLKKSTWLAGDNLTIADLCCVSSLSTLDYCIPVVKGECPKLANFMVKCSNLPYYEEANQVGLDLLGQKIQECIVISYSKTYKNTNH